MAETALEQALRRRIDGGGKAFVPYVTGGLSGVDAGLLRAIQDAGADAIEIGVPFSDPVMDGGVIQEASRRALASGFRVGGVFSLVSEASLRVPVVLMTYLNPVLAAGPERFVAAAREAGVAGFIVPDLPVDEAVDWTGLCARNGLASVFLAAPGTSHERLTQVAGASTGFVYCVSSFGVTGHRESLAETSKPVVEALRGSSTQPLLVGVGITTPAHAEEACAFADGAIVGSALVRHLVDGDPSGAVAAAAAFRRAIPT